MYHFIETTTLSSKYVNRISPTQLQVRRKLSLTNLLPTKPFLFSTFSFPSLWHPSQSQRTCRLASVIARLGKQKMFLQQQDFASPYYPPSLQASVETYRTDLFAAALPLSVPFAFVVALSFAGMPVLAFAAETLVSFSLQCLV